MAFTFSNASGQTLYAVVLPDATTDLNEVMIGVGHINIGSFVVNCGADLFRFVQAARVRSTQIQAVGT